MIKAILPRAFFLATAALVLALLGCDRGPDTADASTRPIPSPRQAPTSSGAGDGVIVPVLTYHNHVPFVTGPDTGLSYDLVALLNERAAGQFRFELKVIPRSRLNQEIEETTGWLIPWVNPAWFGDKDRQKFAWTELLDDANVILSPSAQPVDYKGPESLEGLTLGGVRGHRYVGIDELVAQSRIRRIDGNNEELNLIKLANGRIDVTLLPLSTALHYLKRPQFARLQVADKHHQDYTRMLMVPVGNAALNDFLKKVQSELRQRIRFE